MYVVRDVFLTLLSVTDGTAVGIYKCLVAFFGKYEVSYGYYLIAIAADGINVMMGLKNSVTALLRKDIPYIFIMRCIRHSLALCVLRS